MSNATTERTAPVAIAGGGVVGIALSLFLARQGIRSVVLEQGQKPNALPRAHAVNPRSAEIVREIGIDYETLRAASAPRELTAQVRFVSTLTGHCFGAIPYERQDDAVLEFTPTPLLNLSQPALEQLLLERARQSPLIDLRWGEHWTGASQDQYGVSSSVQNVDGAYELRSRYLIGCDGAASGVRESLGITLSGIEHVASGIAITFNADLSDLLPERPGLLHWVFGVPDRGTFIGYDPQRLWSYLIMTPPGRLDVAGYAARAEAILRTALGSDAPEIPIQVIDTVPWTVRCQVADSFRAENVLLAGDAAHRFPPTGGLGLNTGLQDAHNLAWKLAGVLHGWATDALLDSYDDERRTVATQNSQQSLLNLKQLDALAILERAPLATDPQRLREWLAEPGRGEQVAAAVAEQIPHFDSLALQLGFSYAPGAAPSQDVSDFRPRAEVGRRLPHGWITQAGERRSVLDLLDPAAFTVLVLDDSMPTPAVMGEAPLTIRHLTGIDEWRQAVGLEGCVAVAVRPDGHILALMREREDMETLAQAITELTAGTVRRSP